MKIKILKDTPFDIKGTVLTVGEFRLKYNYICSSTVKDEELFNYLKQEKELNNKMPHSHSISEWFQPVDELELSAIINGVIYSKQIDGVYHMFMPGAAIIKENSIGRITPAEFKSLKEKQHHRVNIDYYYSHPNCKV